MNIFQGANGAATFFILSAMLAGLAKYPNTAAADPIEFLTNNPGIVCLGLFMIVFRVKALFDDHKHFGEFYQDQSDFRFAGFILALISWFFWGWAGYSLHDTVLASKLMIVSILVSTLWIAVHLIEILLDKGRIESEQLISALRTHWVILNGLYILLLVAHVGGLRPMVPAGLTTPLVLLLLLLLVDIAISRSLFGVTKPNPTAPGTAPSDPGTAPPPPSGNGL